MFNNVTPVGAARDADEVSVKRLPLNYASATGDVEAHLAGIDNALGALGGGVAEMIANVAAGTLLGRVSAGAGDSEELTPAQVRALLEVERGATAGADWNSNLANKPMLGSAAATDAGDYATAAQGAKADTAVQPGDLATVATSGAYGDLAGTPALGTAAGLDVGTAAHDVVQLDANGALPAVDGSNLLNLPAGAMTGAEIVGAIDAEIGSSVWRTDTDTTAASGITVAAAPANYASATGDVEAHLAGIDNALGALGGGVAEMIANVAAGTLLGRVSAGAGDSEELTPAQVRALLEVERGATAGADWNSNLANKPMLGSAAATDAGDYATAAQGAKADTAVQPGDLATVATSGAYGDLAGRPMLGALATADTVTVGDIDATGTADGTTYLRGDGAWAPAGGGSATAAGTSYDNSASGLAATDVKAALDELAAATGAGLVAVIAGANATQDVKDSTTYVESSGDGHTQIANAIADGARSLLLVGTVTASSAVTIQPAAGERVDLAGMPNATLAGDLDLDTGGATGTVRLDVAVTGTVTDTGSRRSQPVYSVDGTVSAATGDMSAATYDPNSVAADAFDADHHVVDLTPTNYSAASGDVEAHLAGIDTALGSTGGGGSATAAGTSYDNSASGLAATDVKAALDELAAATGAGLVAVIAGANATQDVKDSTTYVESSGDGHTQIANAIADGARSLLLVGTVTASSAVTIQPAAGERVDLAGMPNATLAGDLDLDTGGATGTVRLDVAVTGTVTDTGSRRSQPVYSVDGTAGAGSFSVDAQGAKTAPVAGDALALADSGNSGANAKATLANVLALLVSGDANNTLSAAPKFWSGSQADYDALGAKDANTLYMVTG